MEEHRLDPHLRLPMKLKPKPKLIEHFSELEDPRIERSKRHKLIEMVTMTLLEVISGGDTAARSFIGTSEIAELLQRKAL